MGEDHDRDGRWRAARSSRDRGEVAAELRPSVPSRARRGPEREPTRRAKADPDEGDPDGQDDVAHGREDALVDDAAGRRAAKAPANGDWRVRRCASSRPRLRPSARPARLDRAGRQSRMISGTTRPAIHGVLSGPTAIRAANSIEQAGAHTEVRMKIGMIVLAGGRRQAHRTPVPEAVPAARRQAAPRPRAREGTRHPRHRARRHHLSRGAPRGDPAS